MKLTCGHNHTEEEILSAAGRIYASRRRHVVTPGAGPGRPRSADRCPCGAMTKARAAARGHRCQEQ